jgi:acyl-CoA reductase-like NAD-dependent aldehyde dehydrogenase
LAQTGPALDEGSGTPGSISARSFSSAAWSGQRTLRRANCSTPSVGMVHINDQTSTDEPIAPFGGVGLSGNGYRIGGQQANLEAFTEMQWVTVNHEPGSYPF